MMPSEPPLETTLSASQALHRDPQDRDERLARAAGDVPFVLYVEGPRDGEILRAWARWTSGGLVDAVERSLVILGGRQPARAALHFQELRRAAPRARGVCILDRDDHSGLAALPVEPGLEFFTWSRRHIESYLLVPRAILRSAGLAPRDRRLRRIVEHHLPALEDEAALREVNAKALLADTGALARELGRRIPPGRIARAMERGDLHPDVIDLLARIDGALRDARGDARAPAAPAVP
jgi:hypothetical protein